ncbi:MAG: hypothetical protein IKX30_03225 [Victivallales bacterium]|nr:hypothetical protein [Victivallales bacterium]
MAKDVSSYDQYLLDMGERRGKKKGESNAILRVIQNKRNRHISDTQIQQDIQLDFGLDEAKASRYMTTAAKA